MAKPYMLKFGSGLASNRTGLSPTMTRFNTFPGGTALPGPGITESPAGSGLYWLQYGTTAAIGFECDGGSALGSDRYIYGVLDPVQAVDQKIGYTTDSFGSTSIDPATIYGFVKRLQELLEGDAAFTKSTGIWSISSRGSSTLLATKTLVNNTTQATKT